ncbi:uncharacterized protein LOC104920031 isoform X2 [Larimichthys crocea]|uniref:uncharacterized protein LOC104920031 isoform X2 n=1 Tax=Larimichthys crocea TaxID=215358 RepID=UPI000F60211D|nr:uncharacterized protein LOC104920031 isoform X2 [Larimichthys crocea]
MERLTTADEEKIYFKPEVMPSEAKKAQISSPEQSPEISYRYRCPGPGVFQCAVTDLIFGLDHEAELQYRTVQWDESFLQSEGSMAAGPLFKMEPTDNAVSRLRLPHFGTKDALLADGLSVVHITEDGTSILKPLEITDTHVVVKVSHLSAFGLVWDLTKRLMNMQPVCGQVLLFFQPPDTGRMVLDVFLLPRNIPVREVVARHGVTEYVRMSSSCDLNVGGIYSLHCEPEGFKIQPERAPFKPNYTPNIFPTFEVSLTTNTEKVTLMVQDQEGTTVLEQTVCLTVTVQDGGVINKPQLSGVNVGADLHMSREDLWSTLEDLGSDDFRKFKWYLKQPDVLDGYQTIKVSELEQADRQDTVDLMVNTYGLHGALKVTKKVLEKINRNDLVQSLSETSSGPEDPALNRERRPQNGSPEDKLFSIRIEFVNRVSEPVLNQLLDRLHQQRILNQEEMDIARSCRTSAEMARAVINMVLNKGSVASSSLIEGLVSLDPAFSKTLGLI